VRKLLLVLLLALPAFASTEDAWLVSTEKSMWEMWKQKDAKSFAALLADDFYDVFLNGKTAGKEELMRSFLEAELIDYSIGDVRVVPLAPDARLLVYRAHVHGRAGGKELEYDVDVTSVWAKRGGAWKSVFYRESLVPKETPW
jgi:hypothetical protein